MAKVKRICPFSHKSCADCSFYVGRHCYTDFHKTHYHYLAEHRKLDFNKIPLLSLHPMPEHSSGNGSKKTAKTLPRIRLKVVDMITEQTRTEDLEHAMSWVWDDPDKQRFINGTIHITSWKQLLDYCRHRAKRGEKEIIIYEAPSYLLIGGG
jgi:hypothetical protein